LRNCFARLSGRNSKKHPDGRANKALLSYGFQLPESADVRHVSMRARTIYTVIYRAYGNELVEDVIAKMKQEKIVCEVATATVWRHGLPRTEYVFSTDEADPPQQCLLQ